MMKKLAPILALSFVNILGYSLLIPVLPEVVDDLVGVGASGTIYGLLLSSYALCQFFAAPILGSLSDHFGRRPLLLVSQLGTLLSWVVFGAAVFFVDDTWMGINAALLVVGFSRIVDGITGGNISVAQAWISDMTTPQEKTKAFGIEGAVFGSGFLIGPLLGGVSYSTSYGLLGTATVAFVISLLTLLFLYFRLPESLPPRKREEEVEFSWRKEFRMLDKVGVFFKEKCLKKLMPLRLSLAFLFVCFTTSIILLLQRDYALDPSQVGLVISFIGFFSVFNQAFIVPKVAEKMGLVKTFMISILAIAIGLITLTPLPVFFGTEFDAITTVLFFANAFVVNFGITTSMTTFRSLITTLLPPQNHGSATGVDQSISSLGQAVTPVLAGLMYDLFSFWTFILYGSLLLIPWFFARLSLSKKEEQV